MKPGKKMLVVIGGIITAFLLIAIFGIGDEIKGVRDMRYGIDICGGVEAIFEPQNPAHTPTKAELATAREVIEMRLDAQNITDREVTVDNDAGYVIVRFPWKSDEKEFNPESAIAELGEMAQLTFRDEEGNVLIEGKNVQSSSVTKDSSGMTQEYVVELTFDDEGAVLFEKITGEMVDKQLGIYMDDKMISNPLVNEAIPGGQAYIDGMADYEEAKTLSDQINSGALPFSLATTSFSTISPTLGNHALQLMIYAGIAAFVLVCLFMVFYYKLPGVVACITLLFQMILQLLSISVPQYTLTLPGIAGVILSLGMAVDANIIISERISEELKLGNTPWNAVESGYKQGFTSVLDGNITTAIVAVILMIFGSGTMLSFGYTLLAGMVINVFVGVTVSKLLQQSLLTCEIWNKEKWFRKKKEQKIHKFYEKKRICVLITGVVLVTGIVACISGGVQLDTQFTGGAVLNYTVEEEPDLQKIEEQVGQVTNRAITLQQTQNRIEGTRSLELTLAGTGGITPEEQEEITRAVQKALGESKVELSQTYAVEPYIGEKALKNSVTAIALSFLFIVIYVWLRFSAISGLSAGVTALIALFHDVFVVFFAFVVFRIPLNDAFVAVILTIIGYSINDTIVVYDRIRENKIKNPEMKITELTNVSISQVLSRSVNTSLTTGICVLTILVVSVIFRITSIQEFALPMFFGLISGCYSSVCIASVLWAVWEKKKINEKRIGDKKDEKNKDYLYNGSGN